jgi:undecaprenyl-phosphate 4-deoxy-4-formamido-L-arabinose transferase
LNHVEAGSRLSTSVVVPLYNSAGLIGACHSALVEVIDKLPAESEIIYVDDGSRDHTLRIARDLQEQEPRVRVVELAGNYGQHAALMAGLERARCRNIVTLDVDLQCDPQDIPRMLAPLANGYDLVLGVRTARAHPAARKFFSRLTALLVPRLSGVRLRDVGCPLNALTRELAQEICRCGELRRFAKPLAARLARRIAEVEIQPARHPPTSSYSPTALVTVFTDFLMTVLDSLFAWAFMLLALLTCIFGLATIVVALARLTAEIPVWLPFATAGLCLLSGVGMLVALSGEYVRRVWRQTSGVAMYTVRHVYEPVVSDAQRLSI